MENIKNIIIKCVNKMETDGKIEEIITNQLTKTFKGIIEDIYSSYGKLHKELKIELTKVLKIDLANTTLPDYKSNLLKIIQSCLEKNLSNVSMEKFEKDVNLLLTSDAPKEIKISELIEKFIDNIDKDDSYGEISFHHETSKYKSRYIYFDEDPDKTKYQCTYKLWYDDNGKIHNIEIDGKDFNKKLILGGLYGFDALLFKMYSISTKIIDDVDDVCTNYGEL